TYVDAGALRLKYRECPAHTVEQHIVRLAAIIQGILVPHAQAIAEAPVGVSQKLVYLDPRKGFVWHFFPQPNVDLCPFFGVMLKSGSASKNSNVKENAVRLGTSAPARQEARKPLRLLTCMLF